MIPENCKPKNNHSSHIPGKQNEKKYRNRNPVIQAQMSQIGDDKYRTCTTAKGCKIECLCSADPAGLIQIRSKSGSHWITADHSKDKNIATVDICSQEETEYRF